VTSPAYALKNCRKLQKA